MASETGHEQASDITDSEADEKLPSQAAPPVDKADIDCKLSLLKKTGVEKFNHKDYGGALAYFNAAKKLDPQCALAFKYLAEIKRSLGRFREALEDLNCADEIQPNNVFTLSTRGTVHIELEDFESALTDLNKADEIDGNNSFIKVQRGVVKRSMGDFKGALEDLLHAATAQNSDQGFVLTQAGVVKRELKDFPQAPDYLNRACDLKPQDAFIYQQRGVVRRELGDLEGALDDLDISVSIQPKDPYSLRRRGVTRREMLDYQGSLKDLNEANSLQPFNDFTLSERGVTKKLLGDFQGALNDLNTANHIKGNQAFTLKHRGIANRELGKLEEALQDLNCANHLEPNDYLTLLQLAKTEKSLSSDCSGALNHYDEVVEMKPNDPSIHRERGTLRRMQGDYVGALEDFNKIDESQTRLYNYLIPTLMETCFTKYAMQDVSGAFEDAKRVRELLGEHGLSSIKGGQLKRATCKPEGLVFERQGTMSHRLREIEESTSTPLLFIEHKDLKFRKDLGSGSFGHVVKEMWVTKNEEVAVKYVPGHNRDAFEYEAWMLAYLQHPCVVRTIGCSYDEELKQGMLVMELMEQNLRSLIDSKKRGNDPPFDLPVAVDIMAKIAEAMEYLHEKEVMHRDLKSSNVLVNKVKGEEEYVVKIADLGMAIMPGKTNMPYFMTCDVGATLWRAPEVFENDVFRKYSYPADVWSYGITCYEILSGETHFEGVTHSNIHDQLLCGLRPELPGSICPDVLKSMLTKCWALVPYERPSFGDIRKTLNLYLKMISLRDLSYPTWWIDYRLLEFREDLGRGSFGYVQRRMWVRKSKDLAEVAFEDVKLVREFYGEHGLSSIKGGQLKSTTYHPGGLLSQHQCSMAQKLKVSKKLTSSSLLRIDHRPLRKDLERESFGHVVKEMWVTKNEEVAVKYVPGHNRDAFEYEAWMLAYLQHPCVVRIIGCSYDEELKQGMLVMELMEQNLRSLIDSKKRGNDPPFDLPVAVDIMAKIAEAMEYLHKREVMHRDLKSSNVLVNKVKGKEEYVVKIADFGLAIMPGTIMPGTNTMLMGATLWRAPEVFENDVFQEYSFPADVWSYAMTCYEILSGEEPFEGVTCARLHDQLLCGLRPELPASICPDVLRSMLTKCWAPVPYERPSFSDIRKTLNLYLGTITGLRVLLSPILWTDHRHLDGSGKT